MCCLRLRLRASQLLDEDVAPLGRVAVALQLDRISRIGEIIDIGVELNIIKKSGSWFSYNETKLGQGRDALKKLLEENPELCDELTQKINETLKETDQDL